MATAQCAAMDKKPQPAKDPAADAAPPQFSIVVENVSSQPQKAWATFGLPDHLAVKGGCFAVHQDGRKFPILVDGNTAHIRCELQGQERTSLKVDITPATLPPFAFSQWVSDQPERNVPMFFVVFQGQRIQSKPTPFLVNETDAADGIWLDEANAARMVWHFRTRIVLPNGLTIFIEGWLYTYHDQEVVEFEINASLGSVHDSSQLPISLDLGSLSMIVGEKPVIDHRIPKGLHYPMWRADIVPGRLYWEAELAAPMNWLRIRTVETTGALLCLPPEDRFGQIANDPRVPNLKAREEAGIMAIAEVWDGHWGPCGVVPRIEKSLAEAESKRRYDGMLRLNNTYGRELNARPYGQPPNSGQTGEQPDFGTARCEQAVGPMHPWALFDLRYSVQAWKLRPYANREPSGQPMNVAEHGGARLYNLRPDYRKFGSDQLGWPETIPYIGEWDTSDNEHRSDNLLYGMFALTRSKSIERTIRDLLACQQLELYQGPPPAGAGLGSPRQMRVLHSLVYAYCFPEFRSQVEPLIRRMVSDAWRCASFQSLPDGVDIRVLSLNEEKYGWNNPDGSHIRCWLTWQEGIAAMAFYGAWRKLQITEALQLALIPARTIAQHGYFKQGDAWFCCYGVRVDAISPGTALPPDAYTLALPNYDVFVYGIHRWSLGALDVLARHEPATEAGAQAAAIAAAFPVRDYADACWRAI